MMTIQMKPLKKMAKEYAQIAVDEIMKSLDDVLHPNPFGQYWNKVKQEIKNLKTKEK